jgi:hypothetical protein
MSVDIGKLSVPESTITLSNLVKLRRLNKGVKNLYGFKWIGGQQNSGFQKTVMKKAAASFQKSLLGFASRCHLEFNNY